MGRSRLRLPGTRSRGRARVPGALRDWASWDAVFLFLAATSLLVVPSMHGPLAAERAPEPAQR
ncbi:hypothetical protein [Methylobacterium sp. ID0610]|uniref:hypothetical protein n=1 Tax=Methylobacterium carpenticola TaxID=3344827 RepID=UPI0036B3296A